MNIEQIHENTIMRCQVGSGLHGVTQSGHDDRDLMSIVVEPPEVVLGLHTDARQHIWETDCLSWRPDGTRKPEGERSGPGYIDLTAHGLTKWATLVAGKGDATSMMPLFAPEHEFEVLTQCGWYLRSNAVHFLSKKTGKAFSGYLQSQLQLMLGQRAGKKGHTNRPELIREYGFDTKAGYHALRLGIQGIELMETGNLTLPIPEKQREFLLDVRAGVYSVEYVVESLRALDDGLQRATQRSDLPDTVNRNKVNDVLITLYKVWWAL